ncbi:MAG: BLUF domain-containing protein [Gemmatimonas sp.]
MQELVHLIYASGATRDLSPADLDTILVASQRNNARQNVSGILLFSEGSFFQVLEGTSADVEATFARIGADTRLIHTTCIIREPIAVRAFATWTMGYAQLSNADANAIVGRNDFYAARSCITSLNPGRARKLLQAFASGRWQTPIRRSALDSEPRSSVAAAA